MYLPNETFWYDLKGETEFNSGEIPLENHPLVPPVFYRAGSILPVAISDKIIMNTKKLRKLPLRLDIYPNYYTNFHTNYTSIANGNLYWDDGESLDSKKKKKYNYFEFELKDKSIEIKAIQIGYDSETIMVDEIRIYGPFKKLIGEKFEYELKYTNLKNENIQKRAVVSDTFIAFNYLQLNLTEMKKTIKLQYKLVSTNSTLI